MTTGFSTRFDAALAFAASAHREQPRKGTGVPGVPYIVHPVQVATILLRHGFDEDLVVAGLLHDTVEDCGVALEALRAQFGEAVAALVDAVSERKTDDGGEARPWRTRKEEQLAHLAASGPRVAALKAADALHNAASTLADVRREGPSIWSRFNASPQASVWYYGEVARLCGERLGADHPLTRELTAAVAALAATVETP